LGFDSRDIVITVYIYIVTIVYIEAIVRYEDIMIVTREVYQFHFFNIFQAGKMGKGDKLSVRYFGCDGSVIITGHQQFFGFFYRNDGIIPQFLR
jgi:hypothetical protein